MNQPLFNAAVPDMTPFISQAQERSTAMAQAARMALSNPISSFGTEAPPVPVPGSMSQGMMNWGQSSSGSRSGASGGDPKAREAYNQRLRELGVPEHVIEGNAWNVQDESAWNFGAVGDNGAAFGANQWNGPRKQALFEFAQSMGMDPSSPVAQADFWHHEMTGAYKDTYNQAVQSGNPSGAALAILKGFERPAAVHLNRRAADYSSRGTSNNYGYGPSLAYYGQ